MSEVMLRDIIINFSYYLFCFLKVRGESTVNRLFPFIAPTRVRSPATRRSNKSTVAILVVSMIVAFFPRAVLWRRGAPPSQAHASMS